MFSTLIPKIRVPRGEKGAAAFGTFGDHPGCVSDSVSVPHEVGEDFNHVIYYEDLHNVRFTDVQGPLDVCSFKELSSGR